MPSEPIAAVASVLDRINDAWTGGRPRDIGPVVHESIVMVLPDFQGRLEGRQTFVNGFVDFCEHARIVSFRQQDRQIDVVGSTAVVSFGFDILYERGGVKYRSTGRDFWVFEHAGETWLAVWRTMLDVQETRI